ncbi:MAG: neocarzinostatin apoprotein domain-containing protein, partial [Acidimicrobiia bacterium]
MRQGIIRVIAIGTLLAASSAPSVRAGAVDTPTANVSARQQAWNAVVARSLRATTTVPDGKPRAAVSATATGSPAITVAPDADLVRGQMVKVTGTDLGTQTVVVVECPTGVTQGFDCDLNTVQVTAPDPSGALSLDFAVHRTIIGPTGRIDCATALDACDLVVADSSGVILVRHALAFDPNASLPQPVITVTPATGLVAGQTVTVAGTGFAAGDFLRISECTTSDPLCSNSSSFAAADDTGAFSSTLIVRLRVSDGSGTTTHCLAVACIVRATSVSDAEYLADAPIAFDPNQPLPPVPTITVVPATGLLHDQSVTVAGTGFDPDVPIQLSECAATTGPFCGEYLDGTQADTSGTFSLSVKVTRLVSTYGPGGPNAVDCVTASCSIDAVGFSNDGVLL